MQRMLTAATEGRRFGVPEIVDGLRHTPVFATAVFVITAGNLFTFQSPWPVFWPSVVGSATVGGLLAQRCWAKDLYQNVRWIGIAAGITALAGIGLWMAGFRFGTLLAGFTPIGVALLLPLTPRFRPVDLQD